LEVFEGCREKLSVYPVRLLRS